MYAKFSCFVRGRRDNAALVRLPSDNYSLSFERRIKQLLDRYEKGIHIDMKDRLHAAYLARSTRGIPARSEIASMPVHAACRRARTRSSDRHPSSTTSHPAGTSTRAASAT